MVMITPDMYQPGGSLYRAPAAPAPAPTPAPPVVTQHTPAPFNFAMPQAGWSPQGAGGAGDLSGFAGILNPQSAVPQFGQSGMGGMPTPSGPPPVPMAGQPQAAPPMPTPPAGMGLLGSTPPPMMGPGSPHGFGHPNNQGFVDLFRAIQARGAGGAGNV